MIAARTLLAVVLTAVACRGEQPAADEHDEHEHEAEHHDEPAHGELPRRVELTAEVVDAMGIRSEPARRERLSPTLRVVGEIEADPDRTADIPARVAGTLVSVVVREGDRVDKGQTIATVRAPGLGAMRSNRSSLQARLVAADAKVARLEGLVADRLAARAELDAARGEAESLRAEVKGVGEQMRAIEVGRGKARDSLDLAVVAPKAGVIVRRKAVVGDPVDLSSVLATVVDLDEAWFSARVFEDDLARVRTGAPAEVRLAAHEHEPYAGIVESVAYAVDPGARTLTARIRVKDPDGRLRLGLFGTADIVVPLAPSEEAAQEAVIVVPQSAVTDIDRDIVVFVRQPDGHFEVHDVVLGRRAPGRVEVVHGLREGEDVVVDGVFNLKSVLMRGSLHGDHH